MSELHYGKNVEWFLRELSAHEAGDIESAEIEVIGENDQGVEGFTTIDITLLAADAVSVISAMQQKLDAVLAKGMELAQEAAHVYAEYNKEMAPDVVCDGQTIQEFYGLANGWSSVEAYLNEVRAEGGPSIQADDLKSLLRFNETSEDGEGYDIDDMAMNRLVELGMVAKERAGMRVITSFGMWVIARECGEAMAVLETQRDRDLAFQRKIAKLRTGSKEGGV